MRPLTGQAELLQVAVVNLEQLGSEELDIGAVRHNIP